MFSSIKLIAAAVIATLLGAVLVAGLSGLQQERVIMPATVTDGAAFPTGTFVSDEDGRTLELRADGTCLRAGVPCTYGVNAGFYSEMSFEEAPGPQVPATYHWEFDGDRLAFTPWGEDRRPGRRDTYVGHAYRPVGETLPLPVAETGFPTGTFVSAENPRRALEFDADGNGRSVIPGRWEVPFRYGVTANLYTEMTFSQLSGDPVVPATYFWDWDGERLAFELWGEDLSSSRNVAYTENTWSHVENPRVVVVAESDIEVGDTIFGRLAVLGVVPAAEVGADVITDREDVAGRVAAAPISKGQPITPDMLEPTE